MEPQQLAVAGLAMVATGAAAYALIYPLLSGEARAEKRQQAVASGGDAGAARLRAVSKGREASRRDQVSATLKEIEAKQKSKRVRLEDRLAQSGLGWTKKFFMIVSAVVGAIVGLLAFVLSGNPIYGLVAGFVGLLGLPRWYVSFKIKRRMKKFVEEFPNAVDVIVRGVKAGLPLNDCVRIIANEAGEPVRGEFRHIIEQQALGISIPEACGNMFNRVPLSEANFFGIVITIQSKTGGSLAEALANLSKVLRERKKMKAKIVAVSTEAKASAAIIGALPFVVTLLVWLTSPDYIRFLWTTETGRIAIVASGFWMAIGISVMRKMINFDI